MIRKQDVSYDLRPMYSKEDLSDTSKISQELESGGIAVNEIRKFS